MRTKLNVISVNTGSIVIRIKGKLMVFWIIFGTASFTTLIVSWAMMLWFSKGAEKSREFAKKKGFCYTCGAPQQKKFNNTKKRTPMGFKK